ncbi:autotransporter-associated beta strand repeat-containing protein, partial [Aquabacter sp. CN5-332]|uniref:beta strand repeat-containing protein n=1 Tax=Aquabacter sp. CN5-332 TaxID=3156608 RepID=UPI0032B47051
MTGSQTISAGYSGGRGGDGATSDNASGGGGGGGGGIGLVLSGVGGSSISSGVNIQGGDGGTGGDGSTNGGGIGSGGGGGAGGYALSFSQSGTFTNSGSLQGGNGGLGGLGSTSPSGTAQPGAAGAGGAGLVVGPGGATIINSGTIAGGFTGGHDGDEAYRASAIIFTGGSSILTFTNATTGLSGGVALQNGASLTIDQPTPLTMSQGISGNGSLTKAGVGNLTLTGASTYNGSTTINAGTLALGGSGALSTGGTVSLAGATAVFDISTASGDRTIGALAGVAGATVLLGANTLSISGASLGDFAGSIDGSGILFKDGAATQTLSGVNTYVGGTTISAGTLALSGNGALAATGAVSLVNPGATFDISQASGDRSVGLLTGGAGTTILLGTNTLTFGYAPDGVVASVISGQGGLVKQGSGKQTLTGANTFTGNTTIDSGILALSGIGGLSSGGSLTLTAAGTGFDISAATGNRNVGALSGVAGSVVTLGNRTLTVGGTVPSATFDGELEGTGGLIKEGAGTQVLGGANTYTGVTTISAGTLAVTNSAALGDRVAGTTVASGATLKIDTGSPSVVFSENFTLSGVGAAGELGALVILGDANFTGFGAGVTLAADATIHNAASNVILGTITGAGNLTLASSSNGNGSIAEITAGIGGVTKTGDGAWILGGNNAYTGVTTVAGGTLVTQFAGGLGSTSNGTIVQSGATLMVLGGLTIAGEALSLAGFGFDPANTGNGALTAASSNAVWTGAITLTDDASIMAGFSQGSLGLTLSGGITTAGHIVSLGGASDGVASGVITGAGGVTKYGEGTWTLSGPNDYTGATTISAGTLALSGAGSIASSSGVVVSGTLDISGTTSGATINDLAGTSAGGLVALGTKTLTVVAQTGFLDYAGSLSGTGTLIKQGVESFTLSGNSSAFAGTTQVNEGILFVSNHGGASAGILGGNVTVASGATLEGVGGTITGAVSVAAGGTLGWTTQGSNIGGLTMGSLMMDAGAITTINLLSPVPAGSIFTVTGNATVNGTLNLESAPGNGVGVYRVFSTGGTLTNAGMVLGQTPTGYSFQIDTQATTLDVVATTLDTSVQYWSADGTTRGGGGNWTSANPWLGVNGGYAPWAGQVGV